MSTSNKVYDNLLNKQRRKSFIALGIFVLIIVLSRVCPLPMGLSRQGLSAIALLFGAIIMWMTNAMPLAVTAFLVVVLAPALCMISPEVGMGAAFGSIWKEFANSVFFFVFATFGLTAAICSTPIPDRIAAFVIKVAKNDSRKVIIGFSLGTAFLSAVMSNVPTCALFASLGLTILKADGNANPGESRLGRALMICIPAASMLGGFMTPAGGPTNLVVINALEQYAGITVSFLQWMAVGIPVGIIGTLVAAIWACKVFKPEPISEKAIEATKETTKSLGRFSAKEVKLLIIVGLMFVFWVSSTWVPAFNTTMIAIMGVIAFFLPGIEILTWKSFLENASWDVLFMIGGVNALASVIVSTGAASWLVDTLLSGAAGWSPIVLLLVISLLSCVLHILIPSGPAVAALAVVPFIAIATRCGVNPVGATMILGYWGAVTYVLPIDAVPMLTYGYGYYTTKDMAVKSGIFNSIVMVIIAAVLIPVLCGVLGFR